MARWCLAALVLAPLLVATSGLDAGAQTTMLSGDDFFRQAKRSISHDKKVLRRLEGHPLAHASGWDLDPQAAAPASPSLGGKRWQRQNDKLEKQLEDMSSSVNTMFSDQKDKKKYRSDEDKLFNQAVSALKTADRLYPDTPGGGKASAANDLASLGLNADGSFAHDEGRRKRRRTSAVDGGSGAGRTTRRRLPISAGLKSWYSGPNLTETMLILLGCTLLAASGWVGFMFCRRKSYKDLRVDRDSPEGIEVP
mmetsp:Transcript_18961/g.27905  ORF Transcript_18961/g.27905 Transcript_18961/m.27905 type:complete len:252 (+) Transcript_18961:38-793(+)